MTKQIYYIIIILLLAGNANLQAQKAIVNGKYTSSKRTSHLKTFTVSKGDIIEFKISTLHKKRGLNIWVKQHPGNLIVFDFEELQSSTKQLFAPADAIYEVFFGGTKLDFNIEIINHTNNPNGPGRDMVYVRIPDTLHTSGYVSKKIGENYTMTPYKEKVKLGTTIQTETVGSRDFITGVDMMNFSIPGDIKDEYREQKLLSYSVSLTVDAPACYDAMMGVVDAGMDAFIPDITPELLSKKSKVKKMNHNNRYDVVKDMNSEKEKWDKTIETLELAQELGDSLAPGKNTDTDKLLAATGFLLDTDGMKQLALEKGLKAVGAPEEVFAIMNTIENIPSATDLLKDGVHKFASKIKGKAHMRVHETRMFRENVYTMPPATNGFWIQSAMNYGLNGGGCWDVPGSPTTAKKNMDIKCWDIDGGIDRKFKFVESTTHPGFYEIHSAMTGIAVDNRGGDSKMKNNGNDIHFWERHGGKSQLFQFKHLGNGKFKIYNYGGSIICLDGRKNSNGTNIHVWEDHKGAWTEWYIVDPMTKKAFVPQLAKMPDGKTKTVDVWQDIRVVDKVGGTINEKIIVANENEPLNLKMPYKDVKVKIWERDFVADAKLLVEAKYKITDYTEVIKYKRTTEPVHTKDFWTAYKVKYDYQIMFKDQVKDGWIIIPKAEFYSGTRPKFETVKNENIMQKNRLMRYDFLTKQN